MNPYLRTAISASIEAGKEILKIYHKDIEVDFKDDNSPLTQADKNANEIILKILTETNIPILSEEGRNISYKHRKRWDQLWIVDPLDGTKEFIKRNGEFTVNIALISKNKPIIGVVYAPALDELYYGGRAGCAFKVEKAKENLDELLMNPSGNLAKKLPLEINKKYYGIVVSRSHLTKETTDYIKTITKEQSNVRIISKGSSLKICMVAEGVADAYPRFAPTSEWDTAAGHAIVSASGAEMINAEDNNEELIYNKENTLNPWFIVRRSESKSTRQ